MARLEYSVVEGIFEDSAGRCFEVGTAAWWEWLESDESKSFRFETDHGVKSYTARKEAIQNKGYFWYAYKKLDKRLHKSYIGKSTELTLERLEAIAVSLGQPKPVRLHTELGNSGTSGLHTELGNSRESEFPSELHTELGNPEIDKLRARLAELEQSNSELRVTNQALEKQLSECSLQVQPDSKEEIRRLNAELRLVKQQREDYRSKWERAKEDNGNLFRELKVRNQQDINRSKLRLNKSGEYYQLRGEAVVYVADLKALGYTL